MARYRAAIIGVGRPQPPQGLVTEGAAIGYMHADGYRASGVADIVAAADIDAGNLTAFADHFGVPVSYADYREMLERERPDLVSVCTWPGLHPEMVVRAAEAGVRGILCEKPMALGLGDADRMLDACARNGTILSVSHQRRLVKPYTTARAWANAGAIGRLTRLDAWIGGGWDLLSYGTHWVDMFFYLTGDGNAAWVFAAIDATRRRRLYGHPVEDRSLTMIGFADGVIGLLHIAPETTGAGVRLTGDDGQIEVTDHMAAPRLIGGRPVASAADAPYGKRDEFAAAVRDLVGAIETGTPPQLSGRSGRKATEVMMAAYASGLEGRLILLPYRAPDFPLERLHAAPTLSPG